MHPNSILSRLGLASLYAAVLLLPASLAAQKDASVEFVSPRRMVPALDETAIELRCGVPPGQSVHSLLIEVDGQKLVTLTAPPWKTLWDAGDGSRGHQLTATMTLTDGSVRATSIHTTALRINQVQEVGLVNLFPMVLAPDGHYVTELTREDFEVFEDDVRQHIVRFSTEGKPLNLAIVLDTSLTMSRGGKLHSAQKAALGLLDEMRERDQAMVVTFSDSVQVIQDLTRDPRALALAIETTEARGGTALYDAIWRTARDLAEHGGRKVLVLLSDGRDEAANGFEPGSLHTLEEALDQALRSDVMVFSIGLGRNLGEQLDFQRRYTLKQIIERLARETGGRALLSSRASRLSKAFREVANDLRHQYSLAYSPTNGAEDGAWREVEVRVPGLEAEVISRRGYYARHSKNTRMR